MPMMTPRIVDVRSTPPAERHARIFAEFDRLAEGEAFVLVTDHDPRPLYYQMRTERVGVFGWKPQGEGPTEWRVEIRRLPPKESERRIGTYFQRDHEEIDVIYGYLRRDVAQKLASAAGLFEEFNERLERHIRWEEEILFPAVEQHSPMTAMGPGRVMRMEHEEIRRLKGAAGEALRSATPDYQRAAAHLDRMFEILKAHNYKEEGVYYPMSDQIFTEQQAQELLRRVRSLR